MTQDLDTIFPRYTDFDPAIPVWCATPTTPGCLHRFFDASPISPSGRYLAVFQLPFEDRQPEPGEVGSIGLVDMATGEFRVVAQTRGWEPQLGAQVNWGGSDHELFFNDVDTASWQPFAWKLNPLTGEKQRMEGTLYHASPYGRWLISADLATMRRTQAGYGVALPAERICHKVGPVQDDGFYLTDTATGQKRLLISIADILEKADPPLRIENPEEWEIYAFHCKFNAQSDRLMLSLRWFPTALSTPQPMFDVDHAAVRFAWLTAKPDGSELHCAVGPEEWAKGGHHATWFPDGKCLSMNLNLKETGMRFAQVKADGTGLSLINETALGTGHPTVSPDGKHVLTDTYNFESVAYEDGTVPLRWVNVETGEERHIVRIPTRQPHEDIVLRIDPHPAWDRSGRFITFNAFVDGTRRVLIADMQSLLS